TEGAVSPPERPSVTPVEEALGSTDHKTIGRLYIAAAIGFGMLGMVAGVVSSLERVSLDGYDVFDQDVALQVFSLHRLSLLYLLVIPITIGLATVVVPLQVGAQTIVFPRLCSLGFWTWLIGGVTLVLSYVVDGGPGGAEPQARELWVAAMGMVVVGLLIGVVVLAATVLAARAPGMGLLDAPFFSLSVLVASVIWIVSLAALLASVVLGFVITTYGPSILGLSVLGAEETWILMSWFAEKPQILSLLIVGLGVGTDVIASISGAAPRARGVMFGAIAAFGLLTFGAWSQTALYPELADDALAIIGAFAVGIPFLIVLGGWFDVLRRGTPGGRGPVLAIVTFVVLALGALVAGELGVIEQLDLFGTSAISAAYGFSVAGALAAAIAALTWWASKIWGRTLNPALVQGAALLVLLGGLLVGLPELIGGFLDQPDPGSAGDLSDTRVLVSDGLESSVELLNGIALAGWALLGFGLLAVTVALAQASTGNDREAVDDDPWGEGQTLEWSLPSPPGPDDFDEVPTVTSPTPLLATEESA
ncbi:MAG: cbb3-type cytochrome c oxidase subunit I, partial [Acidimicrobiales bacterium]